MKIKHKIDISKLKSNNVELTNETKKLKKALEEKENELKDTKNNYDQKIKEKDDKITEQKKCNQKEVAIYTQRLKELNIELKNVKVEFDEFKRKEISKSEQKINDPNQLFKEQLEESMKLIQILKDENKYLENELHKKEERAKKAEEFEAKNIYLNNILENMKKNIEELKIQKKKAEEDLMLEISKLILDNGRVKFQLDNICYEKERMEEKYKRYIQKLKDKLISLGFKFKEKNNQ